MSLTNTILDPNGAFQSTARSIGNIGQAAGRYAKSLKSVFGGTGEYDPLTIRDILTNGFIAPKGSAFAPFFFARAFDEPTYLSFRIEFMFDDELRNKVYNNSDFKKSAADSAFVNKAYDYMPEPFLQESDPTEIGEQQRYSSEYYLERSLGEFKRAKLLNTFKEALYDIQMNFPYYFKSISGLSSLTNVNPSNGVRLKDAKITIDCLEGIDLKITELLNLYRKIVWDDVYQRWVLPDMMRFFGMKIYISEIRTFHSIKDKKSSSDGKSDWALNFNDSDTRNITSLSQLKGKNSFTNALTKGTAISNAFLGTKSVITKAMNAVSNVTSAVNDVIGGLNDIVNDTFMCSHLINAVMPTICYECHLCEFDISNTMSHIDSLSAERQTNAVSPKITINIGQVKEVQVYPLNKNLGMNNDGVYSFNDFENYISDFLMVLPDERGGSIRKSKEALEQNEKHDHDVHRIESDRLNISQKGYGDNGKSRQKYLSDYLAGDLKYTNSNPSKNMGKMQLASAALNKGTELGRKLAPNADAIFGTYSLATDQDKLAIDKVKAVGAILDSAADRIYNSKEIHSMAVSDEAKASIATEMFRNVVETLSMATEASDEMRQVAQQTLSGMNGIENAESATSKSDDEIRNIRDNYKHGPEYSEIVSTATEAFKKLN